ncbi:hypothetical protein CAUPRSCDRAFT_12478 [Caulochytrium protostelioides]|uniref:Uncharacterized protein n=1 Tax=Caulochytrium protostelioides TaxID=1555241 RepID=A0A4P9WWQ0_9FUNG|nr:hypothetical protein CAUPRSCDRAFT_12478 [Caulochytrium protostelioides]
MAATSALVVEEDYNKRLDLEMDALEANLGTLLRAAQPTTTPSAPAAAGFARAAAAGPVLKAPLALEADRYQATVAASNLVRASEQLLALTSELKEALVLNDFARLNGVLYRRAHATRQALAARARSAHALTATLGAVETLLAATTGSTGAGAGAIAGVQCMAAPPAPSPSPSPSAAADADADADAVMADADAPPPPSASTA